MRFQLLSDLHLELLTKIPERVVRYISQPQCNTLILAGDIGNPLFQFNGCSYRPGPEHSLLPAFLALCKQNFRSVLYVPGNHEYYALDQRPKPMSMFQTALQSVCHQTGVTLLDNDETTVEDAHVIGSTLWSLAEPRASLLVNDYKCIFSEKKNTVSVNDLNFFHATAVSYLTRSILPGSVVITHHAPLLATDLTPTSHSRWRGSPTQSAFASDLSHLTDAGLWIYGHTHFNADFVVGKTRYLSNQVGYQNEAVIFDNELVVTI